MEAALSVSAYFLQLGPRWRVQAIMSRLTRAFTLVELLVVIVIIGIVVSITLPLYGRFTQQAAETKTLSNMRQMGAAMLLYAGDNNSQLPVRVLPSSDPTQTPDKWPKVLLPYIQDTHAYSSPIPDVNGKTYRVTDPTKYFDNGTNYTSYIYNGFNDMGTLSTNPGFVPRLNSVAQTTATILLGIPYPQTGQFYMDFSEGGGNNNDVLNRTAFPNNTSVYMFCDGSARMLTYNSNTDMRAEPTTSGTYSDWYWLVNKDNTSVIQ